MKRVEFTHVAERELDEILQHISQNIRAHILPFETRLCTILTRIGTWPESAQEVIERPGIRRVPFIRYPYNILPHFWPIESKSCTSIHSTRDEIV